MKNALLFTLLLLTDFSFSQGSARPKPKSPVEKKVYESVEKKAEFVGGKTAMMRFLSSNMAYPPSAIAKNLEGKCYVRFVVDRQGYISDVKVLRGVPRCPQCDREAMRVIKAMPKWKPGRIGGKAVNSYFDIPINFKLQ